MKTVGNPNGQGKMNVRIVSVPEGRQVCICLDTMLHVKCAMPDTKVIQTCMYTYMYYE